MYYHEMGQVVKDYLKERGFLTGVEEILRILSFHILEQKETKRVADMLPLKGGEDETT